MLALELGAEADTEAIAAVQEMNRQTSPVDGLFRARGVKETLAAIEDGTADVVEEEAVVVVCTALVWETGTR